MKKKAVVLVSGGLDSATVLAIAKSSNFECYALSFYYGQKNSAEINSSKKLAEKFGVTQHKIINLDFLNEIKGSALTDKNVTIPDHNGDGKVPATYVPARNTIFLTMALAWAEVIGAEEIYTGATSADYSGYCDCRPEYFEALQNLFNLATETTVSGKKIEVKTPLLYFSKAQTIEKGLELGVDYSETVTCYQADQDGKACGRCDSCHYRKQGFKDLGVTDPTRYK